MSKTHMIEQCGCVRWLFGIERCARHQREHDKHHPIAVWWTGGPGGAERHERYADGRYRVTSGAGVRGRGWLRR